MARRFRDNVLRFELAPGVAHHRVVVHTVDARKVRRFSFQAPGSSDSFPNANRSNEIQEGANTDDARGPFAFYRLMGTLATPDSPAPSNWTTVDYIEITVTSDGRNRIHSTSDVLLNTGPFRQLRFEMTYYPKSSQDVPTLLAMEESETLD